jgi:AcrR family transcriptional regulator
MPRTIRQFEEIRENRKALIMETALELFAHEGYYTTSISRIASKAGISKGLMYNYFSGKEELIREIIQNGIQNLLTTFDPDHDGILTESEFEYMINRLFELLEENKRYWKLYFSIVMQPQVHKIAYEGIASILPKLLRTQIHYFQRKGAKDPVSEAVLFSAVMDGIALNYILDPDQFPVERIKRIIIEKFSYDNK